MTTGSIRTPRSEAKGGPVYFRVRNGLAFDRHHELVLFIDRREGTVSIEGGPREASIVMGPEEMRSMAGALLDAADAIENAARTGRLKDAPRG